jgi:hypothetical protein
MGVTRGDRRGEGPKVADVEVSAATYGLSIAALLGVAVAAAVLWGCGDDRLRRNDGLGALDPGKLDFGLVRVGDRVRVEVELKNEGDGPLGVLGIEPDGELPPEFVLPTFSPTTVRVAGATSLAFEFAPGEEGRRQGRVIIRTDSLERPLVPMDLGGEARRPLVAVTERLDFGRVVLNTDKVLRIDAMNAGGVPARVTVLGVSGPDAHLFTVGGNLADGVLDLGPRESASIDVRFVAGILGSASAVAHLRVEGAREPDLRVELRGSGFASDLVAYPNCLDFGSVSPQTPSAPQTVAIFNGGNDPVDFQSPTLVDGAGVFALGEARVDGQPGPLTVLAPGTMAEVDVVFTPSGQGRFNGELQLVTSDPVQPRITVCLTGRGGGADISVVPAEIDFGELAPGMAVTVRLMVFNVGTPDGGPLRITGISWDGPGQGAFVAPLIAAPVDLPAGSDPYIVDVTFRPVVAGTFEATLYVESTDGDTPRFPIPLVGSARNVPPCDWIAEPPFLDFGQVPLNVEATLSVSLRNVGSDACIFSSVALARGAPAAFSLPGGGVVSATVPPGGALTVPVRARPTATGALSTNLTFFVSDPAAPQGAVPIAVNGYDGCLQVEPGAHDFGTVRLSCPAVTRTFRLTNRCGATVTVNSVAFGTGNHGPGEFALAANAPVTLVPGVSANIQVSYDPVDEGFDGVPVLVSASVLGAPLTLSVSGRGTANDVRTDTFIQKSREAVDVLFVLDNSGSMMEEQEAIGAGFADFIQYAINQGLDYRIGVTTTGIDSSGGGWAACPGGVEGGEAGRLFPVDRSRPRWIEPTTPNAAAVFAANVQVGVCHWWEEGLEAAYRALTPPLVDSADDPSTPWPDDGNLGFYRPNARLSVIIVTDEDDHSPRPVGFYAGFFQGLKGLGNEGLVKVSGVLGDGCATASGSGNKYKQVITATGGVVEPICTADWGESLAKLAQASFGFTLRFPLSGRPVGAIEVLVNGQAPAGSWTYDAAGNAVVFTEAGAPPPGAKVEVRYVPACGT